MTSFVPSAAQPWIEIIAYFTILLLAIKPLGLYMAAVLEGHPPIFKTLLKPTEQFIYWTCKIDPESPMGWKDYTLSLLIFSVVSIIALFAILFFQSYPELPFDLAFNAAISFVTNTNWQSASPETTISVTTQMIGFTVQNFLSAAVGIAVMAAVARGLSRSKTEDLGNFWVDMTRTILYVLLPLSSIFALILIAQGVVQTFGTLVPFTTLESNASHTLMTGPVASQVAIKQLGTNGGGFFAANAAHPFENPSPLTNFLEMLAILLIPAAMPLTFGKMVGKIKEGRVILLSMLIILLLFIVPSVMTELGGNPLLPHDINQTLGNMEGKEVRIGAASSALWAAVTTAAANGATNASIDSFMPLSGMVSLILIQFGEIVFGGVGSGLYGMLVCVMLTVFIAGLMIGRTPEYLGKKIGVFEMKMTSLVILIPAITTLVGAAYAVLSADGQLGATNPGAQGFSQILYAFSSASNNNGSALAGINANAPFYNILLGIAMLIGRFSIIIAVLAIAGSMGKKTTVPSSAGTLDTTTILFTLLLIGVVILVNVLTYIPALMLGPIAEHLNLIGMR